MLVPNCPGAMGTEVIVSLRCVLSLSPSERRAARYAVACAALWMAAPAAAQFAAPAGSRPAARNEAGMSILPNGRLLTPAGTGVVVAPHPFGLCLSPDGRTLVSSSSGTGPFAVSIIRGPDLAHPTANEIQVDDTFMGLAITPDGRTLYASGGDDGTIYRFDLRTGALTARMTLDGLVADHAWTHSYTGDIALSPDGAWLYALDQANFRLVALDTASGKPANSVGVGRYPFGLSISPDGRRAYVANSGVYAYSPIPVGSNGVAGLPFPPFGVPSDTARDGTQIGGRWIPGLGDPKARASCSVWGFDITDPYAIRATFRARTGVSIGDPSGAGRVAVGGSAPSALVSTNDAIYVSNANDDSVQAFDAHTEHLLWTSLLAPQARLRNLRGVMPFGLAVSGNRLYAAEAGINAVAVLDARTGAIRGHIPVAWWPSKVQVSRDGRRLYVACAKGYGSGPNAGPDFHAGPAGTYVGNLLNGVVCLMDAPPDADLAGLTQRVLRNNGMLTPAESALGHDARHLLSPIADGRIRYVVFITKENRTFDEVFGDLPHVDGLPSLARFGEHARVGDLSDVDVMPNHHALARRYAISDNFYMDGDVSADGHRWLVGIYPNPWMTASYVQAYGDHSTFDLGVVGRRALAGSNASMTPEDYPESGSLWDNLERHHITYRNYGEGFEFAGVADDAGEEPTGALESVNIPMPETLFEHTCRTYPQFNTNIPDQYRVDQFIADYRAHDFDDPNRMPRFLYFHLPNDHGAGARPAQGYPYLASYMADNDLALGRLVQFLSHTPHWPRTAVFVTEDDSQSGVDHVDAHRSICMVISPWARAGYVSHRHTSIASIHKTIDEILGLPPLNLYAALASDLTDCFTASALDAPYTALPSDTRIFDPTKARDPADPDYRRAARSPGVKMDDPAEMERQRRPP